MQKPSSETTQQSSPSRHPSFSETSRVSTSSSISSQVKSLDIALASASTLHKVRSGRLASSDLPFQRQVLEKALGISLNKRLSEISLISPNEDTLSAKNYSETEINIESESCCSRNSVIVENINLPRTSSPLDLDLIRPHTPVSPSSTLDSVFVDDNIGNQFGSIGDGADFRPDINLKGPCQSENISKIVCC